MIHSKDKFLLPPVPPYGTPAQGRLLLRPDGWRLLRPRSISLGASGVGLRDEFVY